MKSCLNCWNMIPIGEGDHICTEAEETPIMVLSEYEPTEDYYKCKGRYWAYEDKQMYGKERTDK